MRIDARVRRTLAERGLIEPGDQVLVAVSGGPDSTALLWLLAQLRAELRLGLVAVGVDHGLRRSAAAELEQAATTAQRCGVPFELVVVDEAPDGGSLHAWARRVRYAALRRAATKHGARLVATGHTADDQAETVLARVLRGGGLRGLSGIDPARADGVVRPLIDCRRASVRSYLAAVAVPFSEDPSNHDRRFERTRVRADVLPPLLAEQPLAVERLVALADEARQAERALDAEARGLLARAAGPRGLTIALLVAAPSPVAVRALRLWVEPLTPRAIGRAHLVGLLAKLQGDGEVVLPGGGLVRRVGGWLTLERIGNGAFGPVSVEDPAHDRDGLDDARDEEA